MSSAVQQLIMKAYVMEESWHSVASFVSLEKVRLQQYLRMRKLKCNVGDIGGHATALTTLTAAEAASQNPQPDVQPSQHRAPTVASRMFSIIKGAEFFGPLPKL
eukprot:6185513-Pleurochrysis_carterae.AAC.3